MKDDFRLIASAPRDGTLIDVLADDFGPYRMRWNASGTNVLASRAPGIWEAHDGAFTWCEDSGAGPTHWRPASGPAPVNVLP